MKILSSYHQQRLWFIDHFEKDDLYEGGPIYHNIPIFVNIDKDVDSSLLKDAFIMLLKNNDILRTRLHKEDEGIFQCVSSIDEMKIDKMFVHQNGLNEALEVLRSIPFDFDNDHLVKCYYEHRENQTVVYFVIHHALIDRRSIRLIQEQYLSLLTDENSLSDANIQYSNFSNWQNGLTEEDYESLLFHWKSKLKDVQVLYFSTDREREQVHIYKANNTSLSIDRNKIASFCDAKGISSRNLFLSAYKMALSRLTGLSDIVIGTLMDLRNEQINTLIGPIENLVVLRSFIDSNKSLFDLNKTIENEWNEAECFKTMPFDKLVLEINPKKDMSRTALFDVLFMYENNDGAQVDITTNQGWGKYDFNLLVSENENKFELNLVYNELYFNKNTVVSLLDLVQRIIITTIENENTLLKDISLVSEEEYNKLTSTTNESIQLGETSIVQRFLDQVKVHPDNIGISWSSGEMTYEELDKKSTQLANFLINTNAIGLEDKVAVVLPKTENLIITILAVLKTGAAYVPIDPSYPEDRKTFIIEDASCKLLIDESFINDSLDLILNESTTLPKVVVKNDNLAYIIYTSGTTGRPKGVMIEHGNVLSLLDSCFVEFEVSEKDVWTLFHSYCFDFSVWELFGGLLTGANVLIISNEEARNQEVFTQLMREHEVTVFSQTPSAFYNFIALESQIPTLRYVVFGGEALNPFKIKDWSDANPQVKLINMYGITETTVHVTYKELTREELSSSLSNIGKPLLFANCYVLDQEQSLLPYGRSGELYISGEGVARGYLNRPDVQEDKFVLCPFDDNEKMYRTGDLVRFMPSGELEYLGRIDDQVKVRGYRIELDEIKKQIDTYSGVQQSAVSLIEMPDGDKSIAAYITLTNQHSISDLKLHLSTKIPEYMIPSFFVKMDEIPINSNGKVDKTKLPSPLDSQSNETQEIIPPSTDLEIKLHEIWSSLLNTERFGLKHNFFELGGHSLKATRLIAAIHKAFEVRLELKQIFANPTLEDQANLISLSTVVDYEKIEKVADQEYYPVSDAQKRLWLLSQLEESSIAYNIPDYKTLHGEYDIESFDKAINATIERHEILRTTFKADENGNVYQYVLPTNTLDFKITYLDYSKNDHKEEDVKKYITNDSSQAFDLENGPLLRATLIMLAQDHYVFYYNLHHIISDGWSKDVLIKDTLAFYEAYKENTKVNLPELNIQYKDYAAWQLAQLETASSKEARQYWTENLSGELPLLDLPTKKIRPKVRNYNGERLTTYISSEDTNRLKLFTQNNGGSLFMGLLSVWNVLFYKYTSLKDVIVGTPIAGRDHIDLENQIGFYINTLALRNSVNPEENFKDFFTKVKESTLAAYKHQSYPFDRLVNDLELRRDTSRNAVFDVMMTLQNANDIVGEIKLSENDIQDIVVSPCKAKFDVDIKFKEIGECLYLDVSYNKDVYDQYIIEGLIKHYKQLLQVLMIQSEDAIAQINYLSEEEQEMLLVSFNDTEASYPKDKTLVDLFAVQVSQSADEVAVIFEETELTYRELDELSDDLANYLLSNYTIASGDLIGIKLDRSEWMIIAILAVLKTGGAYVPIDPSYPEDRIAYIESDSNCKVSIDAAFIETFRVSETKINTNHNVEITPANLAYVIYTSGSTGQPKGVMIEQASLINYLTQASSQYLSTEISNFDFGLFTSLSFDLTVTSIFLPLINGGTLKVFQSEIETSVILKEYIENQISCIKLTPSHISLLANMNIEQCGVEVVIVGGEELQKTHVKALKEINPSIKIFNEYGPTESTVGCIVHEVISLDDAIIIGYPINNTTAYILSDTNSLQPVGVIGELCLGGDGLARGYLNRPELTSEKFVENRFRESELLYKTGDLARWLPDGSIDFLGRKDDQVKIRGHRIELGEIEQHLGSKPGISEVCVLARVSDMGTKELIAYLVSEEVEDVSGLRSYLSDILPDYMLPSYYVQVESMPLTSNGKIDKRSLPSPLSVGMSSGIEYVAPVSKEQQILVSVLETVLKRPSIGLQDNFYNLGGDSIKSIQVVSRLKQKGYSLKVSQLLHTPVVEELAVFLSESTHVVDQSMVSGAVELTPIQSHFFTDSHMENRFHFNQSVLLQSTVELDTAIIDRCISELVFHHDALRMVYREVDGVWQQHNAVFSEESYEVLFYDLTSEAEEQAKMGEIGSKLQSSFDLSEGLLVKVGHFRLSDGDRLALIVHHLVVDGVSWRILLEDLATLYSGYSSDGTSVKLPLKTDSFQRWSSMQLAYASSDSLLSERPYWETVIANLPASLPRDIVTEEVCKIDTSLSFTLDEMTTDLLQTQVHTVYNTEINDILLTGLGLALEEVFGVGKSTLKMEGHGREEIIDGVDISRTVGWFTSMYPFVLDVSRSNDSDSVLVSVKESLRLIPNKGVGYGILNHLGNGFAASPEYSIVFNYLGDFGSKAGSSESVFDYSNESIGSEMAKENGSDVDLSISGMLVSGALRISIKYSSGSYRKETIARLLNSYEHHLGDLILRLSQIKDSYVTPSDVTFKGLSASEFDQLSSRVAIEDVYRLSPLQEGIYYHWLADSSSSLYFEQLSYRLQGEGLRTDLIKQAYDTLIARYAVLRTSFTNDYAGLPLQVVQKNVTSGFSIDHPNTSLSAEAIEAYVSEVKIADRSLGFNLEEGSQMRLKVLDLGDDNYEFIWSFHHILMDGWCISVLINDFYQILNGLHKEESVILPTPVKYSNYIEWLSKLDKEDSVSYWNDYLSSYTEKSSVPFRLQNSETTEVNLTRETLKISDGLFTQVKSLCNRVGVTQNIFIQAVWGYLLSRYNNTNDVVFGTVVSGRPGDLQGVEGMVGLFINTIPVRVGYDGKESLEELLLRLQSLSISGSSHHYLNLSEVQSQSDLGMDLMDHIMVFENYPVQDLIKEEVENKKEEEGLSLAIASSESYEQTNYDFGVVVNPTSDALVVKFEYNASCYDATLMKGMATHFEYIVQQFIEDSTAAMDTFDCVSSEEAQEVVTSFNDTAAAYPEDKTLVDLFAVQVEQSTDEVAVVFEETELTYRELDTLSNELANYILLNYTIAADDLIGIKLDRSEWMIVAILAVLKTGGAYVPIDPSYPEDRIAYIESDSKCKVSIDAAFIEAFMASDDKIITQPDVEIAASDLAYVIYTSGSTGQPKGVMIEHRSVVRLVKNTNYITIEKQDKILGLSNFSFDGSTFDIFMPLLNGAALVISSKDIFLDLDKFDSLLAAQEISSFFITTALFNTLVESKLKHISNLKYILFGGEQVSVNHVKQFKQQYPEVSLHHVYGPTENTTFSTYYTIENVQEDAYSVPIGYPINNTTAYILSDTNSLQPVGVIGELCLGGDGLARGYLNRPELTSEKFVENRFRESELLYKTGDLARWLPDGSIDFLGRKDDQVKIRGHRIELGEIEQHLGSKPGISEVCVLARVSDMGTKELIAYLVSEEEEDVSRLRSYLSDILPDYMLPSYYVQVESMPLTSNGKIDKRSLPSPLSVGMSSGIEYVAPVSKEQQILVSVLEAVLKRPSIGLQDNFYNLGGDSIKSIQVVSRLKQEGYSLKVSQLLHTPVVEELAVFLSKNTHVVDQSMVLGAVELTPIQSHFFTDSHMENRFHFNQSVLLQSTVELDTAIIDRCISELVFHHDALRMVYREVDGVWQQHNAVFSEESYEVLFYDLTGDADALTTMGEIGSKLQSSFDLSEGPLVKVGHFRLSDGDRLALIVHHLVVDGVSWRILLEDLATLYSGYSSDETSVKLPLKTDSFQRWSSMQLAYASSDSLLSERPYWETVIANLPASLPRDIVTEEVCKIDTSLSFTLDEMTTDLLQTQVHTVYNTEINDILLTGLGLALEEVFGVEKSTLKMEGHGREEIIDGVDISRTVGWFTSMYPFVLDVSGSNDSDSVLVSVKESLRLIPNKGVGYGILNHLGDGFAASPEYSIVFNYLGDFGSKAGSSESVFDYSNESIGSEMAKENGSDVDLSISGMLVSGALRISIKYSSGSYRKETIARLLNSYEHHLGDLILRLSQIKDSYVTPSDVTFKGLSASEFDQLSSRVAIEDVYRLSPLQEGIYYHWLADSSSSLYFEQLSYRLQGEGLRTDLIKQAYDTLIARYAVLRTSFTNDYAGLPLQVVQKNVASGFSIDHPNTSLSAEAIEAYVSEVKIADRSLGFNLEEGSQMRLKVLDLGDDNYEFIWSFHHILMDGWCISVLINDFYQILNGLHKEEPVILPTPVKYSNYIEWLSTIDKEDSVSYWNDYLSSYTEKSSVPFRLQNSETTEVNLTRETLKISDGLFTQVTSLCNRVGVTQNIFIQAVWGYLLSRYNNTNDVVFGTVVSGRPGDLQGVEGMVGLFINTIPVRVEYDGKESLEDLLLRLQSLSISGSSHHYLNLSEVQSQSDLGMDLMDHIMVFENYPVQDLIKEEVENKKEEEGLSLAIASSESYEQTNYDFGVVVNPTSDALVVKFEYNASCYDATLMKGMATHFEYIVQQFIEDSTAAMDTFDCVSSEEAQEVVTSFNDTAAAYPEDKTLVDLFAVQVEQSTDEVAVVFEDTKLTYRELDTLSNELANYILLNYTIAADDLIGIKLDRSEWMIVAILAVLKTGGAYVPIDPSYPEDRITYIESDSKCKVSIDAAFIEAFMASEKKITMKPLVEIAASDLAYVIYTSGSTGQPKGVMIEHKGIVNTMLSQIDIFNLKDCKRSLQFASFSFDASVSEIFITLLSGASLYVIDTKHRNDPKLLETYITKNKIDIATIPPSYIRSMEMENIKTLKHLVTAGEAAVYEKVVEYVAYGDFYNAYGPTEVSICGSVLRIPKGSTITSRNIPIGYPISNAQIYILDEDGRMQPKGILGEICIGGNGLSRGYLNKPALTAEKFVENRFRESELLYKTGDLGRWLPDGTIEFVGRADDQVKIRGYRVELEEIEYQLKLKEDIDEAIVLARTNELGDKELVAYLVSNTPQNTSDIRKFLSQNLASYMLPSFYVQIKELPLTVNGKIDKKRLPEIEGEVLSSGVAYVAPKNEIEEQLVTILASELGLEKEVVGMDDNFFDLGINSIKLVKLLSRINKEFQTDIRVVSIFEYPNLNELLENLFYETQEEEEEDIDFSQEMEDIMDLMEE